MAGRRDGQTLTRCCLLQEGIEGERAATVVPWGASLAEVRAAIESSSIKSEVDLDAHLIDSAIFGHQWSTPESHAIFAERPGSRAGSR